jgi:DNA polymerase I-like protein with 3'-5' exonuclease and polymerase domains
MKGSINIQNPPKSKGFLRNLKAREGHVLIQLDFLSLEPRILAEFSRDPALWKIYGPDAKEQDIYLFVAANIKGLGDEIVKYYDPDNPTPEGIAKAKKLCKKERSIAKVVQLASSYGASARTIYNNLVLSGVSITLPEVQQIHKAYWELFDGVTKYKDRLLKEWLNNNGWVLNGFNRPLGVDARYKKDIMNRVIQSTGHDCLIRFLYHINRLREEQKLPWRPWIIDFHDEAVVEVEAGYGTLVAESFTTAIKALQEEIQSEVPILGDPMIVNDLSQIKCED